MVSCTSLSFLWLRCAVCAARGAFAHSLFCGLRAGFVGSGLLLFCGRSVPFVPRAVAVLGPFLGASVYGLCDTGAFVPGGSRVAPEPGRPPGRMGIALPTFSQAKDGPPCLRICPS